MAAYHIHVLRNGAYQDCGEGPWNTIEEVHRFQATEVGMPSRVVRQTGNINYNLRYFMPFQHERDRRGVASVALNSNYIPMDGLYDLLEIDESMTECFEAAVAKGLETAEMFIVTWAERFYVREFRYINGALIFWWIEEA
jgi:hypothetical protein